MRVGDTNHSVRRASGARERSDIDVTHLIVRPTPRVFHRYRTEEISGPLPGVLFKVLPEVYARRFVERGEMMWSTLDWFQNEEDPNRGDQEETNPPETLGARA